MGTTFSIPRILSELGQHVLLQDDWTSSACGTKSCCCPSSQLYQGQFLANPIQPPKSPNIFTAYSLISLRSHVLHPPLHPTASMTSPHWFLPKAHEAESNSIAAIIFVIHYMMKSLSMLPTTSIFSPASFLLRHPTLHQKQHHGPYSLAISINGTFLLIHWIASMQWAFQYVF